MRCPSCGKENPEGAVYCESCGRPMPAVPPSPPTLPTRARRGFPWWAWLPLLAALAALMVGLSYLAEQMTAQRAEQAQATARAVVRGRRTATAEKRATATARAEATETAVAQATGTAVAQEIATAMVEASQTAIAQATQTQVARLTETALAKATGTAAAQAQQTALAQATARALQPGAVLIIQDENPWGYNSIQQILDANGITYSQVSSLYIPTENLNDYSLIIIPSNQPGSFYEMFNQYIQRFEDYIVAGGKLWMSVAAFSDTTPEPLVPGGVVSEHQLESENTIVEQNHPWVQGVLDPVEGNYASHNAFSNLPPGAIVVCEGKESGKATLIEYDLGLGHVCATGQTLEFAWTENQGGKLILENSLLYMVNY